MNKTKYCPSCKQDKSRKDFSLSNRRADGLRAYCKDCEREKQLEYNKRTNYQSEYYSKNHDIRLEKSKQWAKNNREKVNKYVREYYKRPDVWIKWRARLYVKQAVKRGKLIKPAHCEAKDCNVTKIQAHHPDHKKPLDVIWLCHKHHLFITNQEKV